MSSHIDAPKETRTVITTLLDAGFYNVPLNSKDKKDRLAVRLSTKAAKQFYAAASIATQRFVDIHLGRDQIYDAVFHPQEFSREKEFSRRMGPQFRHLPFAHKDHPDKIVLMVSFIAGQDIDWSFSYSYPNNSPKDALSFVSFAKIAAQIAKRGQQVTATDFIKFCEMPDDRTDFPKFFQQLLAFRTMTAGRA